jgi:hypothetical protein
MVNRSGIFEPQRANHEHRRADAFSLFGFH